MVQLISLVSVDISFSEKVMNAEVQV